MNIIADLNFKPEIAGLAALPYYLLLLFTLGGVPMEIDQLVLPVIVPSDLTLIQSLALYFGLAAVGIFVLAFAVGIWLLFREILVAKIGASLLGLLGVSLIGMAYNSSGSCCSQTFFDDYEFQYYGFFSLLLGLTSAMAPLFISLAMREHEIWRQYVKPTLVAVVMVSIPALVFWLSRLAGHSIFYMQGIIPRLSFLFALTWVFFVAARMWQLKWLETRPSKTMQKQDLLTNNNPIH